MIAHRLGPPLASLSVLLAVILFALAGIYTFRQQEHVDARLCQSAVSTRAGLRSTWLAARSLVLETQSSPTEAAQTVAFFDAILATIPPLMCVDNKPVLRPQPGG